jgi:hypothetical protein
MNTESQDGLVITANPSAIGSALRRGGFQAVAEAIPESYQHAVEKGGGEYRGLQPGSAEKDVPDLILFDDPATHTTLALPLGDTPITAPAVRRKIARSRSLFRRKEETGRGATRTKGTQGGLKGGCS